ncbi:hypothetical protein [Sinomonas sp.]|uniref:hypothetical protein n=1 Tax=Sinomonas sp. TaxID=1914986 RepID=UPI003F801081
MPLMRSADWPSLIGASVEIRKNTRTVRVGVVDEAMTDSSVLWLGSDGAQPRASYETAPGYEAWTELKELDRVDRYRFTADRLSRPLDG